MAMVARKKNALKKIWKEKKTEKRKKKENRAPKKKNPRVACVPRSARERV